MTPTTCPSCGYDLRAAPAADCPECGASDDARAAIRAARARPWFSPGLIPAAASSVLALGALWAYSLVWPSRTPRQDWPFAFWFSLFVGLPMGLAFAMAIRGLRQARNTEGRAWSAFALLVALACLTILAGPLIERILR